MKCPACGHLLTPLAVSGLTVDACQNGCAGIWFDRAELRSFDEPFEAAGKALVDRVGQPRVTVDLTERRRCPKCPDSVLMRHFFSAKKTVSVDECPTCAGIWLDAGELEQIRSEYESEAARKQAARAGLEETLIDDRMALIREQLDETLPYDTSRSRIAASVLIVFYLFAAFKVSGLALAFKIFYKSIVPWACVCFPEAFSGAFSPILGTTRKSPRSFIWFFGWLVLLLPIIQFAIVWVEIGTTRSAR
jgi:Zn-finger nucleic acid-binding protein